MQYFNFSRLINKYKSSFTAITFSGGEYDEKGDFVKGSESDAVIEGAIISFKESKTYRSDGTLTTNDLRLFTLAEIDEALKGGKVVYNGNIYRIEDLTENAKFTGVYSYTLRYISAFGGEDFLIDGIIAIIEEIENANVLDELITEVDEKSSSTEDLQSVIDIIESSGIV